MSELGPEAKQIMDAGRAGDEPTDADRARVRASLMRAIAAGTAVGLASAAAGETAASAAAKAGAFTFWKIFAGVILVGAVAGTGVVVSHERSQPAERPVVTAPPASASAAPVAVVMASAEVTPAPAPSAPSVRAPAASVSVSRARPAPHAIESAAPSEPSDTLVAETQDLRAAHGALQSGDPARALALLDEQQAKGQELREEREATRVLALCQLGRIDEGKAAAARFLQANPRSPLADRVRAACAAP